MKHANGLTKIAALALLCTMPDPALAQSAELPPAWLAFERACAGIAAYTATVTVFDKKGAQSESSVFDYSFRKPSSATMRIVKGAHAGGTLIWSGGTTVVARLGSGFLGLFSKTYALHDPVVTNLRGSSIDQLSFAAIISHGADTAGSVSAATGPVIDGVSTVAVSMVPKSSAIDAGLTLEIVDIASTTNLPLRVLGYDGPTLVRQLQFSNVKVLL
jgi:outer membrane lipoprotein-sorting protein